MAEKKTSLRFSHCICSWPQCRRYHEAFFAAGDDVFGKPFRVTFGDALDDPTSMESIWFAKVCNVLNVGMKKQATIRNTFHYSRGQITGTAQRRKLRHPTTEAEILALCGIVDTSHLPSGILFHLPNQPEAAVQRELGIVTRGGASRTTRQQQREAVRKVIIEQKLEKEKERYRAYMEKWKNGGARGRDAPAAVASLNNKRKDPKRKKDKQCPQKPPKQIKVTHGNIVYLLSPAKTEPADDEEDSKPRAAMTTATRAGEEWKRPVTTMAKREGKEKAFDGQEEKEPGDGGSFAHAQTYDAHKEILPAKEETECAQEKQNNNKAGEPIC